MQLSRAVEFTPGNATLRARRAKLGIDVDAFHPRQVEHQATIAHRLSRDIVPATAYCDFDSSIAGEAYCIDDIGRSKAAGDQCRPFVDQSIMDPACLVIPGIAGQQQRAGETGRQFADTTPINDRRSAHIASSPIRQIEIASLFGSEQPR